MVRWWRNIWEFSKSCVWFTRENQKVKANIFNGFNRSNCEQFYISFFLHSPLATQYIFYTVQLVSVFLLRRSFSVARCWWTARTAFVSNTCSTWFKPFHPLINLSLTHGALSILSQHTTVNFHRFRSFCPKKPHYATLFFDGAILQRNVHVFALVAATGLKAERCTAHGWNLQQALSILRNAPTPFSPGHSVI